MTRRSKIYITSDKRIETSNLSGAQVAFMAGAESSVPVDIISEDGELVRLKVGPVDKIIGLSPFWKKTEEIGNPKS